jgi:hypothetical protein
MAKITGPNGQVADVDDDNKLQVFSISQNEDKFKNIDGRYFSIFVNITPASPGNNFFYITNTGIFDLFITDIRISSSVPNKFLYKKALGTPIGGSDAAVMNRKLGNPKLPNATIQEGVNITGLTDDGIFLFEEIEVANSLRLIKTSSNIIIPQGQAVAFEASAVGLVTAIVSLAVVEK